MHGGFSIDTVATFQEMFLSWMQDVTKPDGSDLFPFLLMVDFKCQKARDISSCWMLFNSCVEHPLGSVAREGKGSCRLLGHHQQLQWGRLH